MKVSDALVGTRTVFLDTAPLIYHTSNGTPFTPRERGRSSRESTRAASKP